MSLFTRDLFLFLSSFVVVFVFRVVAVVVLGLASMIWDKILQSSDMIL